MGVVEFGFWNQRTRVGTRNRKAEALAEAIGSPDSGTRSQQTIFGSF